MGFSVGLLCFVVALVALGLGLFLRRRRFRLVGGVLLILTLALAWDVTRDVRRAYPSPEFHELVQVLASEPLLSVPEPRPALIVGDFDGDGVADQINVEYFHMEPILRRATSGMLRVCSGTDGALLLAHAVATPLNPVSWCGDRDGNGTDDVCVEDNGHRTVLGRRR